MFFQQELLPWLCACVAQLSFVHDNLLFTVAALTFAGLLVMVLTANCGSIVAALFGHRIMRTLGIYSYGLSVFNQVFAFFPGNVKFYEFLSVWLCSEIAAGIVHALVGMGLTFAAAWVSWHVWEKRFLELKIRFECK